VRMQQNGDTNEQLRGLVPLVRKRVRLRLESGPPCWRDEITQVVLVALWQRILPAALPVYRPELGSLGSFLLTAIENAITDAIRQQRRVPTGLALDEDGDGHRPRRQRPTDPADTLLARAVYADPSQFLPPSLTRVVEARRKHGPGRAGAEAAAMSLGISLNVFYVMENKAKQRIKDLFRLSGDVPKRNAA